jgi:NADH-quinone oxidoreductase subunit I
MVPYEKEKPPMIPEIDLQHCMYCGLCVQYCPPGAIYHTHVVTIVGFKREDLYLDQRKVTKVQELALNKRIKRNWISYKFINCSNKICFS